MKRARRRFVLRFGYEHTDASQPSPFGPLDGISDDPGFRLRSRNGGDRQNPGHSDLRAEMSACVAYFIDRCDEEPVLDFGSVPPGETSGLWLRLDNTGEVPLTFNEWASGDLPTDVKVTHAFNFDGGIENLIDLPERVEVGERLWVSLRLLPGLSPGPFAS